MLLQTIFLFERAFYTYKFSFIPLPSIPNTANSIKLPAFLYIHKNPQSFNWGKRLFCDLYLAYSIRCRVFWEVHLIP